uniref:Fork-head domain-containing protein n=1 Tax=Mola mola TaxID=94237 RepID=A0A3Q3X0Z6_MOLML
IPEEPPCFSSPSFSSHCTLSPVQQDCDIIRTSHRQKTTLSFFPKPVYSYSILIFMALKNSKTGSLPVSEIYSFMTEHFPYFKTAPDGWKNSVRHNLSLNKCFVKMENKNGTSSRKGCLWALNPARIAKMQEELHKWRRKDPITVRRSMARPECLDHLLGERPDKLRSLPPYNSAVLLSRVAPAYSTTAAAQPLLPCLSAHRPECTHVQPQQPCYPPPAAAHPSNPFTQYSPCGQPAATASLNSPMAGKVPPVYDGTLQAEYGVGPRSMQDSLLEGDGGYDIDMLNPSLTDLQLQGESNLWEELQEDSLRSDPHVTIIPQDHHVQSSCLQVTVSPVCWRKAECEDEKADSRWTSEQQNCLNGLHPVVCSGVESLAEYLTSCTTTISLM